MDPKRLEILKKWATGELCLACVSKPIHVKRWQLCNICYQKIRRSEGINPELQICWDDKSYVMLPDEDIGNIIRDDTQVIYIIKSAEQLIEEWEFILSDKLIYKDQCKIVTKKGEIITRLHPIYKKVSECLLR